MPLKQRKKLEEYIGEKSTQRKRIATCIGDSDVKIPQNICQTASSNNIKNLVAPQINIYLISKYFPKHVKTIKDSFHHSLHRR
jgi:hypothetical protein